MLNNNSIYSNSKGDNALFPNMLKVLSSQMLNSFEKNKNKKSKCDFF